MDSVVVVVAMDSVSMDSVSAVEDSILLAEVAVVHLHFVCMDFVHQFPFYG